MTTYLFVYGTLKRSSMLLENGCKELGVATTKDKFLFVVAPSGIPYAIPEEFVPKHLKINLVNVKGLLYEIPENVKEKVFESLDFYEGVKLDHYKRDKVKVILQSINQEYESYMYIATKSTTEYLLSSLNNLKILKDGWYEL